MRLNSTGVEIEAEQVLRRIRRSSTSLIFEVNAMPSSSSKGTRGEAAQYNGSQGHKQSGKTGTGNRNSEALGVGRAARRSAGFLQQQQQQQQPRSRGGMTGRLQ